MARIEWPTTAGEREKEGGDLLIAESGEGPGLSILKEREGRNMSANTARQKGVYIGILFFSRDKSHTSWMPLFAAPGEIKRRMIKKSVIARERKGGGWKEKYIGGISERES